MHSCPRTADPGDRHRLAVLLPLRAKRCQAVQRRLHVLRIRDSLQDGRTSRKPRTDHHAVRHTLGRRRGDSAARRPRIDLYLHALPPFCAR